MLLAAKHWARERHLPVLAYCVTASSWAVDFASGKEGLLMAPAYAVPAMLKDAQLTLQDFDYLRNPRSLRRAGAVHAQGLGVARVLPRAARTHRPLGSIDARKLNVKGGSVAIGHPFAATGARIVAALAKLLATTLRRSAG